MFHIFIWVLIWNEKADNPYVLFHWVVNKPIQVLTKHQTQLPFHKNVYLLTCYMQECHFMCDDSFSISLKATYTGSEWFRSSFEVACTWRYFFKNFNEQRKSVHTSLHNTMTRQEASLWKLLSLFSHLYPYQNLEMIHCTCEKSPYGINLLIL